MTKARITHPNGETPGKLIYLATADMIRKWTTWVREWPGCMCQLVLVFDDRLDSAPKTFCSSGICRTLIEHSHRQIHARLRLAVPSTAYEAKEFLESAKCDDEPVAFIEYQLLNRDKGPMPEDEV